MSEFVSSAAECRQQGQMSGWHQAMKRVLTHMEVSWCLLSRQGGVAHALVRSAPGQHLWPGQAPVLVPGIPFVWKNRAEARTGGTSMSSHAHRMQAVLHCSVDHKKLQNFSLERPITCLQIATQNRNAVWTMKQLPESPLSVINRD